MNDIQAKIESLSKYVNEESRKISNSTKVVAVFYLVILILVFAYTAFVSVKLREMATPKTVASYIGTKVTDSVPKLQTFLRDQTQKNAGEWADKAVDIALEQIPRVEGVVKSVIDTQADSIIGQAKTTYIPAIAGHFKSNIREILKDSEVLKDAKLAKAMAHTMVGDIDEEMDKYINAQLLNRIDALEKEVGAVMDKPKDKLNQREDAERRALLYSVFLVNYANYDKSVLSKLLVKDSPLSDFVKSKLQESREEEGGVAAKPVPVNAADDQVEDDSK